MPKLPFFEWVKECCKELKWDVKEGVKLLPEADPSWFYCYDDGMTPEAAVKEYLDHKKGELAERSNAPVY
ncbi:hypothetical protein CCP1ISM_930006 [Azospirillaceae bacterium]